MKSSKPIVSVIVPNYNHAPYLRMRLDSIIKQTFNNIEIIILDDCSNDNSKDVIEEYRANALVSQIIYNKKNSGSPFKQWHKGIQYAKGEFIWIAESDDWAESTFLEELLNGIKDCKKVVVAFSAKYIVYSNSKKVKSTYITNMTVNGHKFIHDKMIDDNSVYNASCAIFRKSALQKISTDYQNYRGCGDWLFWIELCRQGNIFYCATPLSYFRQHGENTTSKNMARGTDLIEYWNIFQKLKAWGYVSIFLKMIVSLRYYDYAREGLANTPQNNLFEKALSLWEKEIPCRLFSRFIIPIGITIWKIRLSLFHLFQNNRNI